MLVGPRFELGFVSTLFFPLDLEASHFHRVEKRALHSRVSFWQIVGFL
jgi:hypothetical protein